MNVAHFSLYAHSYVKRYKRNEHVVNWQQNYLFTSTINSVCLDLFSNATRRHFINLFTLIHTYFKYRIKTLNIPKSFKCKCVQKYSLNNTIAQGTFFVSIRLYVDRK